MSIKRLFLAILLPALLISPTIALPAPFVSGSTGADGAFEPTANTVLQIPASGVFNFTTITIPTGVTVTFPKTAKTLPVTILATGNVTINGTINLNGGNASNLLGFGGPGGFDGGRGGIVNQNGKGGGGPGGGGGGTATTSSGAGGGGGGGAGYALTGNTGGYTYSASPGGAGGSIYGNEGIFPAIGGSGGGGGGGTTGYAGGDGGGGGGSITIASSGTITINGGITANGGTGAINPYSGGGGGGSGGSIRLLANTLSGYGTLSARGGSGGAGYSSSDGGDGAIGRIRIEAASVLFTAPTTPPATIAYPSAVEPTDVPSLKITAIGGVHVPESPAGAFHSPDVTLPFSAKNPITVTVSAANIPVGQTVTVTALTEEGMGASATGTLSGSETDATANVALNLSSTNPSVLMATVTYDLAAANVESFFIDGEKVEQVRVAANLGGESSVTYITASGREIPAEL